MDTFFHRMLKREADTAPAATVETGQKGASFGSNAVQVSSQTSALSVAAFHRAIELRAKTMGQLVIEYQTLSKVGGNYTLATRGPIARKINYLLQVQPNPMMTWCTLMEQAEICKILEGNAVIYIERNASELEALWLCQSASYNPVSNTYSVIYSAPGGVVSLSDVPASSVLHLKNTFSNDHGLTGVPLLRYAKSALSIAATNDKLTLDNAAKGGKMKLLVQEEKSGSFGLGRAAKKELEKITDQLNEDVYSKDVILLNNVANVTPISQNAQQLEISQARAFSVREVARLTGVPPILLMDDSNSSYKSPEAATQEFLLRTIAPAIREWENEMNAKLLGPTEYGESRYHLCEKSLMRLDPAGQANIDKVHLETGVMNVNELRAQYDLGNIKGGDIHYISTNLAELGSEKLKGNTQQTEKGGEA